MGGSRSRDVQNLACGSGVGGSRSRDVQNLAYGSGVGGSRSKCVAINVRLCSLQILIPL